VPTDAASPLPVDTRIVDLLASFALLDTLDRGDLVAIAEAFEEHLAEEGDHIVRQGETGIGLALLLDGQAAVRRDGEEVARYARGDLFGEVSALLGTPTTADVVAVGPARYLTLPADQVQQFLTDYPRVCFRLLQAVARRFRDPRRWYSSAPPRLVTDSWRVDGWRDRPALQQPDYPDRAAVDAALAELRQQPPLVFAGETENLTAQLAEVAAGRAFLLQAGDCSESFREISADAITSRVKVIMQMAVVLSYGAGVQVVKVGRLAGQFAKPRSAMTEVVDGVELPVFRGHIVNDDGPEPAGRIADPRRMIAAYHNSSTRLNLVRGLTNGGLAGLDQVHAWNQEFVAASPMGRRYAAIATEIERALAFMDAARLDVSRDRLSRVDLWTSHEALLLPYEEALTRQDPATGAWYDGSAHLLWIGERTRQVDGAHVEFLSGVANPIGCKVGPTATPVDVIALCERLNPARIPGRLTLVSRMGATRVTDALPPLLAAVRERGHPVVWACDPMHGNTSTTATGRKTRHFDDVLDEVQGFFAACAAEATWPGGIHIELTGENVTECLGGSDDLSTADLDTHYTTTCDPRLNARQSLDLAFRLAELLTA